MRYVGQNEVPILRQAVTLHSDAMEPEIQNFLLVITRARELQVAIEDACFQAYCHIEFHTSAWTWGTVHYRLEMSGGGYDADFINREELIEQLERILETAKDNDCNSI